MQDEQDQKTIRQELERMKVREAKLRAEVKMWRTLARARAKRVEAVEEERVVLEQLASLDGGGDE